MRSADLKNLAINLKKENKSYAEIGTILGISRYVEKNLVTYRCKTSKKKRGTKNKIAKSVALCIKREISTLQSNGEKVNCSKLKKNCGLTMSICTIQSHLKPLNLKYKKSCHEIVLSKKNKVDRLKVITDWVSCNHTLENTISATRKGSHLTDLTAG